MPLPIGEFLVHRGVISEKQRVMILEHQKQSMRPFGELAEELLGVNAREVEEAWADQYATTAKWIDPTIEHVDPAALTALNRRQAWQFGVLPMRHEGAELMLCTTRKHLVRAHNFATRHIPTTCYFLLAEPEDLGEALMRHYPMDGMSRETMSAGPMAGTAAALRRTGS